MYNQKHTNMELYAKQLNELVEKAIENVRSLIEEKGTESEHSHSKCLTVTDDEFKFNLEGDRYLTEVYENSLVDNYGYTYGFFGVLGTEELFQLVDYLVQKYKLQGV